MCLTNSSGHVLLGEASINITDVSSDKKDLNVDLQKYVTFLSVILIGFLKGVLVLCILLSMCPHKSMRNKF